MKKNFSNIEDYQNILYDFSLNDIPQFNNINEEKFEFSNGSIKDNSSKSILSSSSEIHDISSNSSFDENNIFKKNKNSTYVEKNENFNYEEKNSSYEYYENFYK